MYICPPTIQQEAPLLSLGAALLLSVIIDARCATWKVLIWWHCDAADICCGLQLHYSTVTGAVFLEPICCPRHCHSSMLSVWHWSSTLLIWRWHMGDSDRRWDSHAFWTLLMCHRSVYRSNKKKKIYCIKTRWIIYCLDQVTSTCGPVMALVDVLVECTDMPSLEEQISHRRGVDVTGCIWN